MNNKSTILNKVPLRGEINLQSDPNLGCFLVTLLCLLGKEGRVTGDFYIGTYPDTFVTSLQESGFILGNSQSQVNISGEQDCYESCFLDNEDILNLYKIILMLSKKGLVEVSGNPNFVGLFRYMGYFARENSTNSITLFNKIEENKETLTFHETNLTYFLVSILLFLLTHKKFSISIPEINYEISLLIDLFKDKGFIKEVSYGTFVTIQFDFETTIDTDYLELKVPKDSEEFIFWAFASVATNGEVRINGLSGNTVATTLKLLSDFGAGFESLTDTSVKIWGKIKSISQPDSLVEISKHLNLTKLCLITSLCAKETLENSCLVSIDTKLYKSLFLDFNRLGGNLKIVDDLKVLIEEGKIKQGKMYLEKLSEETCYARLLFALCANKKVELNNIEAISHYNNDIISKLTALGGKIELL